MNRIQEITLATTIAIFSLTGMAIANEDQEKQVSIFIKQDNSDKAKVDIEIDGDVVKFDIPELKEGESKTFTSSKGKSHVLKKNNGQLTITTADGEVIELPNHNHHHMQARFHSLHAVDAESQNNSLQIMGAKLTEQQKQTIRDAIRTAGIDFKINFIDNHSFISHHLDPTGAEVKILSTNGGEAMEMDEEKIIEWKDKDGKKIKKVIITKKNEQQK